MPETPPLVETEGEHDRAEQFNVVSDSASVLQEDKEATDSDNGTSLDLAVSADDGEVGVVAVAKPALTKEEEERQQQELEALREKYKDWPMKSIEEPHDNDVLYGRGGKLDQVKEFCDGFVSFISRIRNRRDEPPSRKQAISQNGRGPQGGLHQQQTS